MTKLASEPRRIADHVRAEWGPPEGIEDSMWADFEARLGGPGSGGDGGGGGQSGATGGHVVHGLKVVAATVGLAAAGLAAVFGVGVVLRAAPPDPAPGSDPAPAVVDARSDAEAGAPPVRPPRVDPGGHDPGVPAQARSRQAGPRSSATRESQQPPTDPRASGPALAAELALIRAARSAPPLRAMALLDQHAADFADGVLAAERESLRVVNLCRLGRFDAAERAVGPFVARKPGALLSERVVDGCDGRITLPSATEAATTSSASAGKGRG